ncbi:TniQ family protein [Burkholderia stagnalis]
MTPLLFVPASYPDELLGSWLARIRLHNGSIAWREFLANSGMPSTRPRSLHDIVPYTRYIEPFFALLGQSYEDVLVTLTTLPYRLTFDAANELEGHLPGTRSLPKLYTSRNRPSARLINILNSRRSETAIRYCPLCLSADTHEYGEPFWHRAHQLPNVAYCNRHRARLHTVCPQCRHAFLLPRLATIEAARIRCHCGQDLTQTVQCVEPTEIMRRLVAISVSALQNRTFIHARDPIRAFLQGAMHPVGYAATLQRAFGPDLGNKATSLFRGIDAAAGVQLRNTFYHALARECCAMLAALNLDLDMLHAQVAKTAETPDSHPISFSEYMTVERIRERLIDKVRRRPGVRPSQCGREYWYLRLYDPSWLVQQWPSVARLRNTRTPTLDDDRRTIERRLHQHGPVAATWSNLLNSPSGIRARLRDRDWLDAQRARLHRCPRSHAQTPVRVVLHLVRLVDAVRRLSTPSVRPRAIRKPTLAVHANLTISQVSVALTYCPSLSAVIRTINEHRRLRSLKWALNRLTEQRKNVTVSAVINLSGLWHSPLISRLATTLVEHEYCAHTVQSRTSFISRGQPITCKSPASRPRKSRASTIQFELFSQRP